MPDELGDAERTTRIASRWLDPDPLERPLSEQSPVADTVQRHAACEAKVLGAGLPMGRARHPEHNLFAHDLNGTGQVHFPLGERRLRDARWPAEQAVEGAVRHRETGEVVEVLLVEGERAVLTQVEELPIDRIHVLRPAIGSKAHDLILARIDLETSVVGECGVEQTQRIGPAQLLE